MRWRRERSDAELLRAVARGDGAAFEEFYRRTAPWLTVRLRRRCHDDDVVHEVLQETFMAVWRSAGAFAGSGEATGWVWTTASRKLIDAFRRRGAVTMPAGQLTDDVAMTASAEEELLDGEVDARLSRALDRLSPELLAVVRATVLDGLTVRETAVLLGVPEGTVKTRAMRARRLLREALA